MGITQRETRELVFKKTGGYCIHCTDELDPVWHVDHYHPQSRGGTDHIRNLFPSCPHCNISKNDRIIPFSTESYMDSFVDNSIAREIYCAVFGVKYENCPLSLKDIKTIGTAIHYVGFRRVRRWIAELYWYVPDHSWLAPLIDNRFTSELLRCEWLPKRMEIVTRRDRDNG